MKISIDPHLTHVLQIAAASKNKVAAWVITQLNKQKEDVLRGTANHFLLNSYGCISACKKTTNCAPENSEDNTEKAVKVYDNPKMYTDYTLGGFLSLFKNKPEFNDIEVTALSEFIRDPHQLRFTIAESYEAFLRAYHADYYATHHAEPSSLHNSCMRTDAKARYCSTFYSNNAKARIITVFNENDEVVGRAIVWPNITLYGVKDGDVAEEKVSLVDRIYSAYPYVVPCLKNFAKEQGIMLCKETQSKDCSMFNRLNYEDGVLVDTDYAFLTSPLYGYTDNVAYPWLDTLHNIVIIPNRKGVYLASKKCTLDKYVDSCKDDPDYIDGWTNIATAHTTCGAIVPNSAYRCSLCGSEMLFRRNSSGICLCDVCAQKYTIQDCFGKTLYTGETILFEGKSWPAAFIKDNDFTEVAKQNFIIKDYKA